MRDSWTSNLGQLIHVFFILYFYIYILFYILLISFLRHLLHMFLTFVYDSWRHREHNMLYWLSKTVNLFSKIIILATTDANIFVPFFCCITSSKYNSASGPAVLLNTAVTLRSFMWFCLSFLFLSAFLNYFLLAILFRVFLAAICSGDVSTFLH